MAKLKTRDFSIKSSCYTVLANSCVKTGGKFKEYHWKCFSLLYSELEHYSSQKRPIKVILHCFDFLENT